MLKTAMRIRIGALLVFAGLLVVAQAPKSPNKFQQEYLLSFNDAETKVVSLAKAMPAEKYSWRPGKDVRSVGEVYVHIANGNRLLLGLLNGMPAREAFMKIVAANERREKTVTGKDEVIADLVASFQEVHTALDGATDTDLSKSINLFGQQTTQRADYLTILEHASEHMGQSIAYARMNGVVPPWSRGQSAP